MANENDRLKRALMGRMSSPTGLPVRMPSQKPKMKPQWRRFMTGQKMQNAYANNWTPNPILIRLLDGEK